MNSTGWSPKAILPTRWTARARGRKSESSILEQRKSCFTGLSSAGKKHLAEITAKNYNDLPNKRAFMLCCRILPDRELKRLLEKNEVRVRGVWWHPFSYYQLGIGRHYYGSEVQVKRISPLMQITYCVHLRSVHGHRLPIYDEVAAFYLTLKHRPLHFHRTANMASMRSRVFG